MLRKARQKVLAGAGDRGEKWGGGEGERQRVLAALPTETRVARDTERHRFGSGLGFGLVSFFYFFNFFVFWSGLAVPV